MKPDTRLVDILSKNKCKVMYRSGGKNVMFLWIEYSQAVNNKPGENNVMWGNSHQIFEKVNMYTQHFYPQAELVSQSNNRSATYRIAVRQ